MDDSPMPVWARVWLGIVLFLMGISALIESLLGLAFVVLLGWVVFGSGTWMNLVWGVVWLVVGDLVLRVGTFLLSLPVSRYIE